MFSVTINIVTLVFWLYDKFPTPAEKAFSLNLTICKSLANISNGQICYKSRFHILMPFTDKNSFIHSLKLSILFYIQSWTTIQFSKFLFDYLHISKFKTYA